MTPDLRQLSQCGSLSMESFSPLIDLIKWGIDDECPATTWSQMVDWGIANGKGKSQIAQEVAHLCYISKTSDASPYLIFLMTTDPNSTIASYKEEDSWNFTYRRNLNDREIERVVALLRISNHPNSTKASYKEEGNWNSTLRSNLNTREIGKGVLSGTLTTTFHLNKLPACLWAWTQIRNTKAPFKVECFCMAGGKKCMFDT
ncbi:hypothetical protein H5410_052850 [Solanum commersonii]|uniref:Uncharacterized protein n=1 Tax=Solanum commersonii TaxID=4109 RepID=A0A9J5X3C5_SOLCO|nr:hypothetical protein H5410_052850 [Solanum commersonii]